MGKIADILQARGEFDEALRIRREEQLPVYERPGRCALEKAVTHGPGIADILQARGELDEALRIRREEQLPVYERPGRCALEGHNAWDKVADILEARGELDEARRIRPGRRAAGL
jgi:tetratricopeptide (TPR) repeat protein